MLLKNVDVFFLTPFILKEWLLLLMQKLGAITIEIEIRQIRKENIIKLKHNRWRAITLQGALEKIQYFYCNIGIIKFWKHQS